jgi:hypothetical protein
LVYFVWQQDALDRPTSFSRHASKPFNIHQLTLSIPPAGPLPLEWYTCRSTYSRILLPVRGYREQHQEQCHEVMARGTHEKRLLVLWVSGSGWDRGVDHRIHCLRQERGLGLPMVFSYRSSGCLRGFCNTWLR